MRKLKKLSLKLEIKNCQMKIEKEKKEYVRYYYYTKPKLLNHLINRIENLENFSLNKKN